MRAGRVRASGPGPGSVLCRRWGGDVRLSLRVVVQLLGLAVAGGRDARFLGRNGEMQLSLARGPELPADLLLVIGHRLDVALHACRRTADHKRAPSLGDVARTLGVADPVPR